MNLYESSVVPDMSCLWNKFGGKNLFPSIVVWRSPRLPTAAVPVSDAVEVVSMAVIAQPYRVSERCSVSGPMNVSMCVRELK